MEFNPIVVFVTAKDTGEARIIAQALLDKKLAACVSISSDVTSMYWWDNKIEESKEVQLIIKAERDKFDQISGIIKKTHSYDVPEILALPVVAGESDYLGWMQGNLS